MEPSLRWSTGLGPVWPPLRARRCVESTNAAERSSSPAARSSAGRRSCSCCHTSASCHSVSRRQQVAPEAPNNAGGSRFHPIPVWITYRMPSNAARSSARLRPGWRKRLGRTGISGPSRSHSSSVRTSSPIPAILERLASQVKRNETVHDTRAAGPFTFAYNHLFTFRDGLSAEVDSYVVSPT